LLSFKSKDYWHKSTRLRSLSTFCSLLLLHLRFICIVRSTKIFISLHSQICIHLLITSFKFTQIFVWILPFWNYNSETNKLCIKCIQSMKIIKYLRQNSRFYQLSNREHTWSTPSISISSSTQYIIYHWSIREYSLLYYLFH
jgi:hypothetical protein